MKLSLARPARVSEAVGGGVPRRLRSTVRVEVTRERGSRVFQPETWSCPGFILEMLVLLLCVKSVCVC